MLLNSNEVTLGDDEGNDAGRDEDDDDFNGVECLVSDDARDVRCVEYEDDNDRGSVAGSLVDVDDLLFIAKFDKRPINS